MKRKRLLKMALWAALALAAFCALTAIALVADGLTDNPKPADVAIVFGSKVEPNGRPSARLRARLDAGAALYHQALAKDIIVSGGFGKEGYDEAVVMKQYLVDSGIPADRIVVDSHGDNTLLTAQNAALIMKDRNATSAIIVSQYFHISRARLALKRCGVSTVTSVHAKCFEPRDFYSIAREVAAYYAYLPR